MTTFSQLIDEVIVQELKRPDFRLVAAAWLNQTIRDVHSKTSSRAAIFFGENRNEEEFTIPSLPALWPIASPSRFQKIEAIYASERGVYLTDRLPSVIYTQSDNPLDRFYYYRSGPNIVMNGLVEAEIVKLSYFLLPKMLTYYTEASRPAYWDPIAEEYVVSESFPGTDQEAVALVSNWLLERHGEALKEGVRSKAYKRLDNENQAKMTWSEFESMREAIHHLEGV